MIGVRPQPTTARPVLSLRSKEQQPALAGPAPQQIAPDEPFVWAEGGKRMTQGQIDIAHLLAQKQITAGTDTSPIGHWTQGVDRVLQALLGGMEARRADKAQEANTAYSQQLSASLSPEGKQPDLATATRAATDPFASPEVRELGKFWMDRLAPKPSTAQPYRWEDNAGNVWERGADGTNQRIFTDIAPKQIVANGQLITSTNPFVDGGQSSTPAPPAGMPQPGAIVADPRQPNAGGGAGNGVGTFRP